MTTRYVRCIFDPGYRGSIKKGRRYEILPDPEVEAMGFWRVVDETGMDFLYYHEEFGPPETDTPADLPTKRQQRPHRVWPGGRRRKEFI